MHWPFLDADATLAEIKGFLQLAADPLPESRTLEYKQDLDADSNEIARDISAMANGGGGLLLYGVAESGGSASAIPGIEHIEAVFRRIDDILRERCDMPPLYTPAYAQAETLTKKVLVLQVRPEMERLIFVREDLRSPAKFSCYIRTGPGKGVALTTSQLRHELIRRNEYLQQRDLMLAEFEASHPLATRPDSVGIGLSFSPGVLRDAGGRLSVRNMAAIEQRLRRAGIPLHTARTSLTSGPWMTQRTLEGIKVRCPRGNSAVASFSLTDTGLLAIEHTIQFMRTNAVSLMPFMFTFEGERKCLNFGPLLEIVEEWKLLVHELRSSDLLPLHGQWSLRANIQRDMFLIHWFTKEGGRRCSLSPYQFTTMLQPEATLRRIGTVAEPFPATSPEEVTGYLLTAFVGGFGFESVPG